MGEILDYASDLKAIAKLATQPERLRRTLGSALHALREVIPYDLAVLYELEGRQLTPMVSHGPLSSEATAQHQLTLDRFPTIERVLDTGRPLALLEEHHDGEEGDPYDGLLDLPAGHACMLIPLRSSNEAMGLITLDRQVCESYDPQAVALADVYGQLISMALAYAEQSTRLDRYRRQLEAQQREIALPTEASAFATLNRTRSEPMRQFLELSRQVARTELPLLVRGETGSGKSLAARAIHELSERADRPFVTVNCAAIPEGLFESELFGHKRGAFSGAIKDRAGRFVAANGGTLLLDEIGDMPMSVQAKLLRVLQDGEFEPVGSDDTVRVDVRLIAASHLDFETAIEAGRFRRDLFYRLAAVELALPPLRERGEDVVGLAEHTLETIRQRTGRGLALGPCAKNFLSEHPWPGNVRELGHAIERAAALSPGSTLLREHFAPVSTPGPSERARAPADEGPIASLKEAERQHLLRALARSGGKIYGDGGAAQLLGLKPTTLQSKLKKHGLK